MSHLSNKEIRPDIFFKNKTVLITGACGTIGKEIARTILKFNLKALRLFDIDDSRLTELSDELEEHGNVRFLIGDIKDRERLIRAFEDVDYIFHCAALKHVGIGEFNPRAVIQTNVLGTENVIDAALKNNVKKVIYTSSDKAVNPTNTMGASKLLGEKLIVVANYVRGSSDTIFASVRFGNVLGSRGSIIPRFEKKIQRNQSLTVTDPKMTRFMMPVQDAVNLVVKAMIKAIAGEIFVLKMPSVLLEHLVALIEEFAWLKYGKKTKIKITGLVPGEKNYEELLSEDEVFRAVELDDMYVILPYIGELREKFTENVISQMGNIRTKAYHSSMVKNITKETLRVMLKANDILISR